MPDRANHEAIVPGAVASSRPAVSLTAALLVAVGAGIGAVARFGVEVAVGPGWTAMWLVNVAGSLLLGLLVGALAPARGHRLTPLVGTGLLGGFTTFSTTTVLALASAGGTAMLLGLTICCVVAAAAGWWLGGRARR